MVANAPTLLASALRFGEAIRNNLKLDGTSRELVIMAVARLEGGVYEWVQHIPIAERAGCTREQIAALEELRFDDGVFDARRKAMLVLVREVMRKVKASEAAVNAAKAHFSDQEIVEIIFTAGFYMMVARLTETTRVEIDGPQGVAVPDWGRVE